MKKQAWIIFFFVILIFHLTGLILKIQLVEYVSKPMIVVVIGLSFLSQTNKNVSGLKKWVLAALFFSLAGDVLLMFQQNDKLFFSSWIICFPYCSYFLYCFSFT